MRLAWGGTGRFSDSDTSDSDTSLGGAGDQYDRVLTCNWDV
jgi:hypothetical protein